MMETMRTNAGIETVIADDHFIAIAKPAEVGDVAGVSKAAMKAYRRAKKASAAVDARARVHCAALRAKREGTTKEPAAQVAQDVLGEVTTSTGEQASIFDF